MQNDAMSVPRPRAWNHDASPTEIESRAELAHHLSLGSLAGLTIEGLHFEVDPPDFAAVDVPHAMFVGCRFADADTAAELVRRGASVVPIFEETPYPSTPSRLYTADDLDTGFDRGGYAGMYDTVLHQHFLSRG